MTVDRPSTLRLCATLCTVLVVVLAGCGSSTAPTGDASPAGDGNGDGANPSGTAGVTGLSDGEWDPFGFDREATYTFDVYMEDEGSGTLVWDVSDVTDDGATVSMTYDVGDTHYESTVTGDRSDLEGQLLFTPAGPFLMLSVFSPTMGYFEGETLTVGNEWSYQTPDGSMRTAVTGTDSYAGVDCYASVMEVDGETVHEGCVNPDLGLAPYTAYFEEGSTVVSMELSGFDAN